MKKMLAAAAVALAAVSVTAQDYAPSPDLEALHVPYDALLDLHVRDGLVYYRALQGDRARLRSYIASLNSPSVVSGYAQWSSDQKKAFWLNAYNALVLQTVVDRLSHTGNGQGISGEQHQADSRRVRTNTARDRGEAGDAGSDRNRRAGGARRPARVPRARAGGCRQRTPSQRGIQHESGREAARADRKHSLP